MPIAAKSIFERTYLSDLIIRVWIALDKKHDNAGTNSFSCMHLREPFVTKNWLFLVTSRVTWQKHFFAYNSSGKHFNPGSCGVFRNQRSKLCRFILFRITGGPFAKNCNFECIVILHARPSWCSECVRCLAHEQLFIIRTPISHSEFSIVRQWSNTAVLI